jgi:ABC-type transport system substrate-binding protein
MKNLKLFSLVAVLVIAAMVLAACPQPEAQVVEKIVTQVVEVEKVVEQTVVTEVEKIVEQTVVVEEQVEVAVEDFTTPHPILSDLKVRQAISYCMDRAALIASVYPYVEDPDTLFMDSGWPTNHWVYGGPYEDLPRYDPEAGAALLDEAGWTLPEGATVRQNADGETLSIKFTTTTAQFRQTWSAVFVQNMAACGIQILPNYVPASWWFGDTTGLARRDFELGAFAWVGQTEPAGRTLYSCDQIPLPSNGWEGQNYMGWCNQTASDAVGRATNSLLRDERVADYNIVQQESAKDVPFIPVFQRAEAEAWGANLEGIRPDATEYATANAAEWTLADGGDTIVIGMTQEPDSLWATISSMAASALVRMAIDNERTYSQYSYDFQPRLQDPLSTIESGLASNNDVEAVAGDLVYDTAASPVTLEQGVMVFDKDGNEVEFDGTTPVPMKQLVVTYKIKPFTWSDGTPGSVADFQLGQTIDCDPDSGATSFITCESIKEVEWGTEGVEFTVTYLPGVQNPTYFLSPFAPYPSARVISDGRVLADVPAAEWQTLPEITELPLSWGPYAVTEWVKGQSLTLAQNPYYEGEVATPNIIFVFLADTNQAVAQLLNGDVDYLDDSTLGAGAEVQTVIDAANTTGAVEYEISASSTWEHIDMNLFTK